MLLSDLTRKCMQISVSVMYCNSASVVTIVCITFMKNNVLFLLWVSFFYKKVFCVYVYLIT